jgi:hypothetical protein
MNLGASYKPVSIHTPAITTSIYSKIGELLMDFTIPSEFFQSIVDGWNQMLHLGDLSNKLVDYLHDQKYNFINGKMYK